VAQSLLTRRDLLKGGAALAGAALLSDPVLRALAAPPRAGRLEDIEHVVILTQENRSFDHYFGTYPAVRGFDDRHARPGVFRQRYVDSSGAARSVVPFHLDTTQLGAMQTGECTNDITHGYGDQHTSWNNGAMDRWAQAHAGDGDRSFMGYYQRGDLPFYHALADAFTLCDAYHCSVMGSTSSNRLYALTGMLDPLGKYGGPVLSTRKLTDAVPASPGGRWGVFSRDWITYPEQLTDAGVSWRYYGNPDGSYEDNPIYLFEQYWPQNYSGDPAMAARAAQLQANLAPVFPNDFLRDAALGTLPSVSWLTAGVVQSEHPAAAPHDGENITSIVVGALMASPLWSKTALFVTYDENGGFFDHVVPPTPPAGTPGEFVAGHSEPIGLGFRVPMTVVSPFSRGGFVCRDRFDHTSLLRFLERRFGVRAANITEWRRHTVGDLTAAFNFVRPDQSIPLLPVAPPNDPAQHPECLTAETQSDPYPSPDPAHTPAPHQEPGARPSPSGLPREHRERGRRED
jgi:phospholipase C